MRIGKPKSKRTPVRLRHKIEKASASKQRKDRKQAKKNPQWVSRLKKDPGIPNLFPYKAKMLAEMEEAKRLKQEEQQHRREIAKAQRLGTTAPTGATDGDGDALLDDDDDDDEGFETAEEMDIQDDSSNPMAALLASAQARAQTFPGDEDEDSDSDDDDEEEPENPGKANTARRPAQTAQGKALPQKVLADPIKAVSALLERMQQTQDGIQRLLDYYRIAPLVTAGSDMTSRFLVEVARKTGRLGKGGVPNLHSAGLTVLTDLNEDRLQLPAVQSKSTVKTPKGVQKGSVQVVTQLAQPFRIEGLWGDDVAGNGVVAQEEMVVET